MGLSRFFSNILCHGSNFMIYPGAYDPRPRHLFRPSDLRPPLDYEEVILTAKDGVRVRAYVICQPEPEELVNSENKNKQREVDSHADHGEAPGIRDEIEGYVSDRIAEQEDMEGSMEDLGLDLFTLPQQYARRRPSRSSRRSSRRSSNATALPTPIQPSPNSQIPSAPIAFQAKRTSNPPMERSSTSSTQKTPTPTTPSSPQFAQNPDQSSQVKPPPPATKVPVRPITPTILMFHGNANDIGRALPLAQRLHRGPASECNGEIGCRALWEGLKPSGKGWGFDWEDPEDCVSCDGEDTRVCGGMKRLKSGMGVVKCNVVMLSPRGYGNSEGSPSMRGFQRDADAALDYILAHPRLGRTPIILYGQSLGGAIAIDLAARRGESLAALIVENTFTSLRAMIRDVLPIFKPVAPFIRAWNSLSCFPPPENNKTKKARKGKEVRKPSNETSPTDQQPARDPPAGTAEEVLPGKGQRRSWLAKLRNIFTRMTKVNCKSDEESQNLPHNGRKPVRSHPKRTISIYPQNEAGPGKTSGGGHVEGRGKKDKGVPRSLAVLMLSGAKDGVVPPAHMKTLWEAATAPFGDGSQCDAEAVEHEVLVGGPSRRGTTSSEGGTWSETTSSDQKPLQLEPESQSGCGAPDDRGQNVRTRDRLATFASFPQGNHVDTWDHPGYWGVVGGFLERCVGRFASLDTASSGLATPTPLRRDREGLERGRGVREVTADSGIGMDVAIGDPRVDALRREKSQPKKRQSWDGATHRRRESWESMGLHRPVTSGSAQVSARVGGSTRARSRSSSPPSPSIMESLVTASAWAAPEESVVVPKAGA